MPLYVNKFPLPVVELSDVIKFPEMDFSFSHFFFTIKLQNKEINKLKNTFQDREILLSFKKDLSGKQTPEYIYEEHTISFQTFFVLALLLIVHTWNSTPLQSNLLRLQCTCCTVTTTYGRPHGNPLVWVYQWPSSQSLSSPQLSHNDRLWA